MPTNITQLSIFVSAPSSMDVQRRLVTTVIEKLPEAILETFSLKFKVLNWETEVVPGVGEDAQAVIASQIGDAYDIYIGLLGSHFGSATLRAGSGTEEEFDGAYSRYEKKPDSVRILFYFMTSTQDVFSIDLNQLKKVKAFKEKLRRGGVLFHDCSDNDALAKAVTDHLLHLIQKQWNGKAWNVLSPRAPDSLAIQRSTERPILQFDMGNLPEVDLEEPGILDVIISGTEATNRLLEVLKRITEHHNEFTASMIGPTAMASAEGNTPQRLKWIIDEVAGSMKTYARNMTSELPTFKALTDEVVDSVSWIANAHFDQNFAGREVVERMPDALQSLIDGMRPARAGMETLRNQMTSVPGFTSQLKKAQRMIIVLLDEYVAYMTVMIGRIEDNQTSIRKRLIEAAADAKGPA